MGKALVIKGVNYLPNSIPTEIQKLSWIGLSDQDSTFESSPNGRYISSGVTFNTDIKISVTFRTDNSPHSMRLPGSRFSNNTTVHAWVRSNGVEVFFGAYGPAIALNSRIYANVNLWDGQVHTIDISRLGANIDNNFISWNHEINPIESSNAPIYLDCASDSEKINTYAQALNNEDISPLPEVVKIENVKIWTDCEDYSTLVVDAIPVKRFSDEAVCFYNKIDGSFFLRNDGSTPSHGL
jgi:hypothetical protein